METDRQTYRWTDRRTQAHTHTHTHTHTQKNTHLERGEREKKTRETERPCIQTEEQKVLSVEKIKLITQFKICWLVQYQYNTIVHLLMVYKLKWLAWSRSLHVRHVINELLSGMSLNTVNSLFPLAWSFNLVVQYWLVLGTVLVCSRNSTGWF